MEFIINENELVSLCGLPHIQQLAYIRGIRPYMDVTSGVVGVKRGVSYCSIAEQLYIEPCPGIKSVSYSRAQLRRALAGLERAGLIILKSEELKLIIHCPLATLNYFVQNKAVTNPSQQAVTERVTQTLVNTGLSEESIQKPDIAVVAKADTPLIKDNNYIYLLPHFEKFWDLYPEQKSKPNAWAAFQALTPDEALCHQILTALKTEINHRQEKTHLNLWVPAWKYPANWLKQRCFEDKFNLNTTEVNQHGKNRKNNPVTTHQQPTFWVPDNEEDPSQSNVLQFRRF